MASVKHKQWIILSAILGVFLIIFLFIWLLTEKKEAASMVVEKKETHIQPITPPLQEIWVDQTQSQTKILQKKVDILTEQLKAFEDLKKTQKEQLELIQGLKKDLEVPSADAKPLDNTETPFVEDNATEEPQVTDEDTVDNTIPAGAFAEAILVGGVDALTGTTASSDPQPVLLRLIDHGTLPRGFRSDVKNCHVLASAYGDKSSERVMMRLVKMSCVEIESGIIRSMPVKGYVSGEDGKTGVRGVKVDLSGPMVRNSLVGGFYQ